MNECVFKYPNTRKEEEWYGREEKHGKGFILNGFFPSMLLFFIIFCTRGKQHKTERKDRETGGEMIGSDGSRITKRDFKKRNRWIFGYDNAHYAHA